MHELLFTFENLFLQIKINRKISCFIQNKIITFYRWLKNTSNVRVRNKSFTFSNVMTERINTKCNFENRIFQELFLVLFASFFFVYRSYFWFSKVVFQFNFFFFLFEAWYIKIFILYTDYYMFCSIRFIFLRKHSRKHCQFSAKFLLTAFYWIIFQFYFKNMAKINIIRAVYIFLCFI